MVLVAYCASASPNVGFSQCGTSRHVRCLPFHSTLCAQTCLKEFADWLVARGASDGQGNRFALPCPIEGDKVGGAGL